MAMQSAIDATFNYGTHTHTHTVLRPSWILSRTTQVSRHHKGKTNLYLLEQEIVSGSGISWAICKSAPWPRHITMPASYHSVFYRLDALLATQPSQSTEGTVLLSLAVKRILICSHHF